jgi:hypothetical protein
MRMKYEFEYDEISDCGNCPARNYDHADRLIICNITDESVRTNFHNEQWWQEAIAELMMKCPLEVVK